MCEPLRVVAGGDEELARGLIAHAVHGDKGWGRLVEDGLDVGVEHLGLVVEGPPPPRHLRRARLAAASTVMDEPGRQRSTRATFFLSDRPASWARMASGAVSIRLWSWLAAAVRAFMAPERAIRSWRSASIGPVPALGVDVASPLSTARTAASASRGSDLPRSRRFWRLGRFTSTTLTERAVR